MAKDYSNMTERVPMTPDGYAIGLASELMVDAVIDKTEIPAKCINEIGQIIGAAFRSVQDRPATTHEIRIARIAGSLRIGDTDTHACSPDLASRVVVMACSAAEAIGSSNILPDFVNEPDKLNGGK